MEECTLVKLAQQGDRKAFCELYGLYKDRYYRYAFYRLRHPEDAEDAVADCILTLWKSIPSLRSPDAFASWSFRILAACCAKRIRTQMDRHSETEYDPQAGIPPASLRHEDNADLHLILKEALAALDEKEREIVLLSYVSGLKSREIADITGMSAGAVRSSLSRSLQKMRSFLA
jgi:RNA polymerase sigma-70 factor (ECF subfamily)